MSNPSTKAKEVFFLKKVTLNKYEKGKQTRYEYKLMKQNAKIQIENINKVKRLILKTGYKY